VTGTANGSQFMMNLAYETGVTATSAGGMTDSNHLTGTIRQPGTADYTLTLTRQ
jgi:hypothetical protein